jgi:hypothetical protein
MPYQNVPKDGKWHRVSDYNSPEDIKEHFSKMKFEQPKHELFCKKCGTTTYIYDNMKEPYVCDNCKAELIIPL